jgi:hypothetical protein
MRPFMVAVSCFIRIFMVAVPYVCKVFAVIAPGRTRVLNEGTATGDGTTSTGDRNPRLPLQPFEAKVSYDCGAAAFW